MLLRVTIILAVLTTLVGLTHTYLYRRLFHDTGCPTRWRRLGAFGLLALGLELELGVIAGRVMPAPWDVWLAVVGYIWMGVVVLLVSGLVLIDVVKVPGIVGRRLKAAPVDYDRRRLFARGGAVVAGLGASGAAAMGVRTAAEAPIVTHIEVSIDNLPAAFDGFRIAHLTDMHFGPLIHRPFGEAVVAQVNALDVDLVALTGDFVDGSVEALKDEVAPLAGLKSRHGSFFVTGNHEYYSGADAWIAHFTSLGIRVLRNERISIERGGASLDVLGVDDWRAARFDGHGHDLAKAVTGRDPKRVSVLLAHQPKVVDEAAEAGIDLVLSGHTHGGQMWPWGLAVALVQPYVRGLHRHGPRTWIYVHSGTGYWGPPMRIGTHAEIAIIRLVRSTGAVG